MAELEITLLREILHRVVRLQGQVSILEAFMAKTRADLDAAISGQTAEIKALTDAVGQLITANQALVTEIQSQGAVEDFADEVKAVSDATAAATAALSNVQNQTAADNAAGNPPTGTVAQSPAGGGTTATDPGLTPVPTGSGGTTGGAP